MAEVEIYLATGEAPISFLCIPIKDVERLSVRPFKWLRFLMYTICGAPGEISATPRGDPVEYDSTELADVRYYYKPQVSQEDLIFVDIEGLNDRVTSTSSVMTRRSRRFRGQILQRDGSCVITGKRAERCDAAHLIPRAKGDQYIQRIIQDRSHLDGSELATPINDIDDIRNGVLLSKDLHAGLGDGEIAFLKTPNFRLEPADIPWVGEGTVPDTRVTPHQFVEPDGYDRGRAQHILNMFQEARITPDRSYLFDLGAPVDANFQGTDSTPPIILLNFMYGVAAYQRWKSPPGLGMIKAYFTKHYETIPVPSPRAPSGESSSDEQDDPNDSDYVPESGHKPSPREKAMEELDMIFMYLRGITPEEAAIRREKRLKEEEQVAQEAGRRKVMGWIDTVRT